MPHKAPLSEAQRYANAAWGVQDLLVIHSVPAAASAGLVNQKLVGQTLTVDGVYRCLIPLSGIVSQLQTHIKATFGAGSVTIGGPDTLYYITDYYTPGGWTVKVAGTGDGALTTTVLQSASVTAMLGEQYAVVTITTSGTSALFTQAEYNGV